jgi:serine/threonine protein kinase
MNRMVLESRYPAVSWYLRVDPLPTRNHLAMPSTAPEPIDGRYQLGEVIGAGGMGEVRAARDVRLQRDVAIKLLHAALLDRPGMRERIGSEARAAARLSHPNVVAVFDAGVDDGEHPYIVMERLQGRTLADELTRGPMPIERVRSMAIQVLDALAAAHAMGLVHRDVKPGNVLAADDDTWKVADFGIAKWMDESGITRTGEVLGSPGYLAPERFEGTPASPSSDLYSVGVLLYEALTGRRPAEGDHAWAMAAAAREGSVTPLLELRPEAGPALGQIVDRAMSPDPTDRFPSAGEMAEAIRGSAHATAPLPPTMDEAATTAVLGGPLGEAEPAIEPAVTTPIATPSPPDLERRASEATARKRDKDGPSVRSIVTAMVVGAVALMIVLVVVIAIAGGPGDTPAGASPDIPTPLADALDRLEESIP